MTTIFKLSGVVLQRSPCFSAASWRSWPALQNSWLRVISSSTTTLKSEPASAGQVIPGEDYFDKQVRLKRPMSPHLTIYEPQLTAMLSITHRGTGAYMATVLSGFSLGMLVLPGTYPYYLGLVSQMHFGPAIIFMAKMSLAFPLCFHALNGIRHLFWDMGYGFSMPVLYKTGYAVLGLALVVSGGLALL